MTAMFNPNEQWCLSPCLASGPRWQRSSLVALYFGGSPPLASPVCKTSPGLLRAASLSALEVSFCQVHTDKAEAGFSPLVQVYLSRFYTRRQLGIRVAFWLAMAPLA